MKLALASMLLASVTVASAANIAVIDSGLDYKHEQIVPHLWTNAFETEDRRDEDNNGYQDDVHGWNFAEQTSQIIDYKYLGTFSPDCKKFFDIQGKVFLGKASDSDKEWIKVKQSDAKFIAELGKFGNFVHGTHVASIAARDSKNKVMGIKLIPTEVKPFIEAASKLKIADRWDVLGMAFSALAKQQISMLAEIARFVAFHKMDVANGSFGTGFKQAKMITDASFRIVFFRKPTEEESKKAAGLFISTLVSEGKAFVDAAPDTLFVFAAGNDGMSNDDYGTSPANIKADNVITVGATYKNEFFAPFSNYGTKMVDIAAPGMLIHSAIPGNDYLEVSGTSQASPYVANVAAQIKEANPKLKPIEIKNILVGTVDKKGFLSEKVTSSGIVNTERAVVAAQLSTSMSIAEALTRAKTQVEDVVTNKEAVTPSSALPLPLFPLFR